VEPLGDLGAKPRGRGAAAEKRNNVLIYESYPQAKPFIKDLLSFLYKSFLVYKFLEAAPAEGFRGGRRRNSQLNDSKGGEIRSYFAV